MAQNGSKTHKPLTQSRVSFTQNKTESSKSEENYERF